MPKSKSDVAGDVFCAKCPARYLITKLSSKWSLLIIDALKDGPMRNGELMRFIDGISQKMLTQTIKELAEMKLVHREDHQTIPPHVVYSLTPLGEGLQEKICSLDRWIEENVIAMVEDNNSIPLKLI
ncbi:helix-turn-helix transcriptional regulator [Kordiimonas sp. SCSIO 12603]|nr:helix-turn-helix transcriptional regulator [Kordiimonas sp. SCSIO 12603]